MTVIRNKNVTEKKKLISSFNLFQIEMSKSVENLGVLLDSKV